MLISNHSKTFNSNMLIDLRLVITFFVLLSLQFDGSASESGAYEVFDRVLDISLRQERIDAGICEGETDDSNNSKEWDLCLPSDALKPKESHCMCDDKCSDYKDCCADRVTADDIPHFAPFVPNSCLELYSSGRVWTSVYGIDRCDDQWMPSQGSHDIQQKCELSAKEFNEYERYSYLHDIPVLSETSKTMYRNIFCAICNSDADRIRVWNTTVECQGFSVNELLEQQKEDILPDNYDHENKKWNVSLNANTSVLCSLAIQDIKDSNFIEDNNLRKCKKSVDKCPNNSDVSVSQKCESYASYVYTDTNIAYKNYHCALCNGAAMDYLSCFPQIPEQTQEQRDWSKSTLWFPLLLDFNFEDNNLVGDRQLCNQSGQLYDPVHKKCISICSNKHCRNKSISLDTCSAEAALDINKLFYQILLSELSLYVSILCLSLHLTIYALIPKLRNLPGKNLMCLSGALTLGHISFAIGAHLEANRKLFCVLMAIISHYSYLAAFFWMSVLAYDVFKTFGRTSRRSKRSNKYKFLKYSLYGWLSPAIVVMISAAFDIGLEGSSFQPLYGCRVCWIAHKKALFVFFALPVAVIVCANIFLFALTANALIRTEEQTKILNKKSEKVRYILYIKLAFIMGLTWTFGLAASATGLQYLWYPFIVLNCLQGAVIFVAFTCKRKVCVLLCERFGCGDKCKRNANNSDVVRSDRSATTSSTLATSAMVIGHSQLT